MLEKVLKNIWAVLTCVLRAHVKHFINGKYLLQNINFQSLDE